MEHDRRRNGRSADARSDHGGPERQIALPWFTTEPQPRAEEPGSKPLTIEERFEIFHAENPEVYVEFVRVAREKKAEGNGCSCSHRLVWEVMRRDSHRELNDHYITYYAQLAMELEPDLEGCFELRRRRRGIDEKRRRSCSPRKKEDDRENARWRAPTPDCSDCDGTGWKPAGRVGVVECGCRREPASKATKGSMES